MSALAGLPTPEPVFPRLAENVMNNLFGAASDLPAIAPLLGLAVLVGVLLRVVGRRRHGRGRRPEESPGRPSAASGAAAQRRRPARPDVAGEWRALLDRTDVLIVDTETNGRGDGAEVIEVAVVDTTGQTRFESLALPEGRIRRRTHGLTFARLKAEGARPWPLVHPDLVAALDGAEAVLAWNSPFDLRILVQTARRHGLDMPALPWRDLLADYRRHTGEAPAQGAHTLARAIEREKVPVSAPAHRAGEDCRRTLAVMRAVAGR